MTFSPDGRYVATGSFYSTARLWDAATGAELRQFIGHPGGVGVVAFSPDGAYLACAQLPRDLTDEVRRQYNIAANSPTCP